MAKKVVAPLKTNDGSGFAKIIRTERSKKTGAYFFSEELVSADKVKEALAKKK